MIDGLWKREALFHLLNIVPHCVRDIKRAWEKSYLFSRPLIIIFCIFCHIFKFSITSFFFRMLFPHSNFIYSCHGCRASFAAATNQVPQKALILSTSLELNRPQAPASRSHPTFVGGTLDSSQQLQDLLRQLTWPNQCAVSVVTIWRLYTCTVS